MGGNFLCSHPLPHPLAVFFFRSHLFAQSSRSKRLEQAISMNFNISKLVHRKNTEIKSFVKKACAHSLCKFFMHVTRCKRISIPLCYYSHTKMLVIENGKIFEGSVDSASFWRQLNCIKEFFLRLNPWPVDTFLVGRLLTWVDSSGALNGRGRGSRWAVKWRNIGGSHVIW